MYVYEARKTPRTVRQEVRQISAAKGKFIIAEAQSEAMK